MNKLTPILMVDNLKDYYNNIKARVEIEKDFHTTWYEMDEFYICDTNGYILGFAEKTTQ
jgi:hypothetical protein